jgi:hypothetical protein
VEVSHAAAVRPVTPGMRWMLWAGCVLVFLAGVQLYILSDRTDAYFAWTVRPPLTAAFLGAFYWAAFVLAYLSARERVWAYARVGVPGVLLFVTLTLVATLLHLDRFHLQSPSPVTSLAAWAWLVTYILDPLALWAFLILQLRTPGGDPPRIAPLPRWFRLTMAVQAVVALAVGIALVLDPVGARFVWPWELTPLTARAAGAWVVGMGVNLLQAVWEDDWTRIQFGLISYIVLGVLQLVALARYPDSVNWSKLESWLFLLFLFITLFVGAYGSFKARQSGARQRVAASGP